MCACEYLQVGRILSTGWEGSFCMSRLLNNVNLNSSTCDYNVCMHVRGGECKFWSPLNNNMCTFVYMQMCVCVRTTYKSFLENNLFFLE